MSTAAAKTYQQAEGLEVHEADDGLIVFNATTDRVHHLNPTTGVIFELCLQPRPQIALLEALRTLYQNDDLPDAEILQTLGQLLTEGLLEEAQGI